MIIVEACESKQNRTEEMRREGCCVLVVLVEYRFHYRPRRSNIRIQNKKRKKGNFKGIVRRID